MRIDCDLCKSTRELSASNRTENGKKKKYTLCGVCAKYTQLISGAKSDIYLLTKYVKRMYISGIAVETVKEILRIATETVGGRNARMVKRRDK